MKIEERGRAKYRPVRHKYIDDLRPLSGNFLSPLDTSEHINKFKGLYERRAGKEAYNFNNKQTYFNFIGSKDEPIRDDLNDLLFIGSIMVGNLTNALLVL
ncbi:hypothetical protein ABEU81_00280 [Priestia megaterium]